MSGKVDLTLVIFLDLEVRMFIRKWELVYKNLLIHIILQGVIASYWSARRSKL